MLLSVVEMNTNLSARLDLVHEVLLLCETTLGGVAKLMAGAFVSLIVALAVLIYFVVRLLGRLEAPSAAQAPAPASIATAAQDSSTQAVGSTPPTTSGRNEPDDPGGAGKGAVSTGAGNSAKPHSNRHWPTHRRHESI